jgi:hypothetical protein
MPGSRPICDLRIGQQRSSLAEYDYTVANLDGLFELMGNENRRGVDLVSKRDERFSQVAGGHLIERAKRLVSQQELRPKDEGTSNGDSLAHAAGQLVRISMEKSLQAEPIQPIGRCTHLLGIRDAQQFERQLDVVQTVPPRQQTVLLEDRTNFSAERLEIVERVLASRKVDFPQPVVPTIATISPLSNFKSSRSIAITSAEPDAGLNTLRKSRTLIDARPAIAAPFPPPRR